MAWETMRAVRLHLEIVFGAWIFLHMFIAFKHNCIHVCKITKEWKDGTFLLHLTSPRVFQSSFWNKYSNSSILFQSQSVRNSYWVLRQKSQEVLSGTRIWTLQHEHLMQLPLALILAFHYFNHKPTGKSRLREGGIKQEYVLLNRNHSFLGQNLSLLSFNLDAKYY